MKLAKTEWPRAGEIWYHFPTDTVTKIQDVNWETKFTRFTWGRRSLHVKTWEFADRYVWRRVTFANGRATGFEPPTGKTPRKQRLPLFVSAEQRRQDHYQKGIR